MSAVKFITFKDFVKAEYEEKLVKYKIIMEKPPSVKKFTYDYIKAHGFREWLAVLGGLQPTEKQLYSIVSVFIRHGGRKVDDLPALVVSLEKHHNIYIPALYGVLTAEYWRDRIKVSAIS
jgi:hypothetical protein